MTLKPQDMTDADIKRHAKFLVGLVNMSQDGQIVMVERGKKTTVPIEVAMEIEIKGLLGRELNT